MLKARELESSCVVDEEGRVSNLTRVLERGFPSIERSEPHDRKLAVVGSGPSVKEHLEELRTWDGEVWAINGAYDYLVSQGVIPQGFVGMDPLPGLAEYVLGVRPESTAYLASFCDLSVFDNLEGKNVVLWHPESENMIERYPKGSMIIGGGSTVMTRAPFLAHCLGYRDITLFGADSSFDVEYGPYCYQWGRYGCDIDNHPVWIKTPDGQGPFLTEVGMMKQVSQLGVIIANFRGMLKVKCGGLMNAFLNSPMGDDSNIDVVKESDNGEVQVHREPTEAV